MITIPESIVASIIRDATAHFPRETGGIFVGRGLEKGAAIVSHVIGPGPRAKHRAVTFEPDYQFQEAEIARLYMSSGGACDYLGDWHSHPMGPSTPSGKDVEVLKTIGAYAPARCKKPIMCIVSGGPSWKVSFWQMEGKKCIPAFFAEGKTPERSQTV